MVKKKIPTKKDRTEPLKHVCVCGKGFKTEKGMIIHRGKKKCYGKVEGKGSGTVPDKTCSSHAQEIHHSSKTSSTPETEPTNTTPKIPRICWPRMNDDKTWKDFDDDMGVIISTISGPLEDRVATMQNIVFTLALERFGEKAGPKKTVEPKKSKLSKRKKRIGDLKVEKNSLRKLWKSCKDEDEKAELNTRFEEVKKRHKVLLKAECAARKRKEKKREKTKFLKDPFKYTKKLFTPKTSGRLNISKDDLENYLTKNYSDEEKDKD